MRKWVMRLAWPLRWLFIVGAWCVASLCTFVVIHFELASVVTVGGSVLSWVDWMTLSGVVLAVAGLAATFGQVVHTRTTAEAATAAVDRALVALAKSELLVDFQTIRQLEYELERTKPEDQEGFQKHVRDVREVGARVATALRHRNPTDPLAADVDSVRQTASDARTAMVGARKNANYGNITRKLREELIPLCDKISTRMAQLRLDVEEIDDEY
jgi:hypothetical protein